MDGKLVVYSGLADSWNPKHMIKVSFRFDRGETLGSRRDWVLASCEVKGVKLANCPAYIREWIKEEASQAKGRKSFYQVVRLTKAIRD